MIYPRGLPRAENDLEEAKKVLALCKKCKIDTDSIGKEIIESYEERIKTLESRINHTKAMMNDPHSIVSLKLLGRM